jgi:hypothetical protein
MFKQIILFIILIAILLVVALLKSPEKFNEIIQLHGDFYIPNKDNIIDFENRRFNANKICIFKENETKEVVDLECIDYQTLISTLNLPQFRKNSICIDDKCLTKSDIELLNGSTGVKLQSKNTKSDIFYDKFVSPSSVNSHYCGVSNVHAINTLSPIGNNINPGDPSPQYFSFEHAGGNKDSDVSRTEIDIDSRIYRGNINEVVESHHKNG